MATEIKSINGTPVNVVFSKLEFVDTESGRPEFYSYDDCKILPNDEWANHLNIYTFDGFLLHSMLKSECLTEVKFLVKNA